eukprot:5469601-Alexandrium_andersonii.AAC.1
MPDQADNAQEVGPGTQGSADDEARMRHLGQVLNWGLAGLLLRPFSPLRNVPRACQPVFVEISGKFVLGRGGRSAGRTSGRALGH